MTKRMLALVATDPKRAAAQIAHVERSRKNADGSLRKMLTKEGRA